MTHVGASESQVDPPMHVRVTKRDGASAPFDAERIRAAVGKAFEAHALHEGRSTLFAIEEETIRSVTEASAARALGAAARSGEVSVEEIQNIVEAALMAAGHPEIARRYIIYREERRRAREIRSTSEQSATRLEQGDESEITLPRIEAVPDKWLLDGGKHNVLQLHPVKYTFALEYFDMGCANTWFPKEIPMAEDLHDWETKLTPDEKRAVKYLLGFFCTAESLVANNIAMAIYPSIPNPEARLYLGRQAYEEMNHTVTFEYVVKSLNLDRDEIFRMHETVQEVARKDEFEVELTRRLVGVPDLTTLKGKQDLVRNLVAYYVVMEGIFFYSGFMMGLSFERRKLLKGLGTLIRYVLKDETIHLAFGLDLIHTILMENPEVLTPEFSAEIESIIDEAVRIEADYARAALPNGILGLNARFYDQYVQYIADRRLVKLGLPKRYGARNPAKWMVTQADVPELINFFEAKPIDYEQQVTR